MSNKLLVSILATFAFMNIAFADHHEGAEGGEAATEKKPFSIYGDFAGSWTMQSNERSNNSTASPATHDSFAVDNANLNIEKNWSHSKLHLQVGYGTYLSRFAPITAGAVPTGTLNLVNGYYAMQSSYGLGFMMGKYNSPMGYESFTIMNNRQYTRSWGFNQHNYFQTGFGVNYDVNGMANVGFHVSNGTQGSLTDLDNNVNKSMALVVGITAVENLGIDLKYQTGVDTVAAGGVVTAGNYDNTVMEITAAYKVNDMFDFAIDYLNRKAQEKVAGSTEGEATSIAAYLNGNFGLLGASFRYEMFSYDHGMVNSTYGTLVSGADPNGSNDNKITSMTLGVHYDIDQNARFLVEYRMDKSDDQVFTKKDGSAGDGANTGTLGLMYRF